MRNTPTKERKEEFKQLKKTLPVTWARLFILKKYGTVAKKILADIDRIENAKRGKVALSKNELEIIKQLSFKQSKESKNTAEALP